MLQLVHICEDLVVTIDLEVFVDKPQDLASRKCSLVIDTFT